MEIINSTEDTLVQMELMKKLTGQHNPFTLTGQISQLQLDVIRMQDSVAMNSEFRVKWPRGELGALPDDAKQDLRIQYLQEDIKDTNELLNEMQTELETHLRNTQ